jgi:hypothetical protein
MALKINHINIQIPSFRKISRLLHPLKATSKTDQRAITLNPARKGLSAVEIHADLVATLGSESASYPSVTGSLRHAKFAISKPSILFSKQEPKFDDSGETIVLARSERSFALVRQFMQLAHLS